MKKMLYPLLMLLLVSFSLNVPKLTDAEREAAVAELTKTQDRLVSVTEGLSEEQLNFKGSPESWSVAECVEHLALAESNFDQMLQASLQETADPSKRAEVKISDADLIGMVVDRSHKVKTSEAFEPSGKFGSFEATLEAFTTKRQEHIDYVKTTEDDLRNHFGQLPFGTIDSYQILMFMSGHTERHVQQMEEVMANENFPDN